MARNFFLWKAEFRAADEKSGPETGPLNSVEELAAENLKEENAEFLRQHPAEVLIPSIRKRAESSRRGTVTRFSLAWTPLAAAAMLLIFLLPWTDHGSGERLKGGSSIQLAVYRERPVGDPEKLAAEAVVRPGDVLQAAYRVPRALFGALLSIDGNNTVTVHLGQNGQSVLLVPGGEKALSASYELDKAPRFEVFALLTSENSFDLEAIRTKMKSTPWKDWKASDFGAGISLTLLPLEKAEP